MTLLADRPAPVENQPSQRKRRRRRTVTVLKHLFLIIVVLMMLYPVIWLISSSFKPNDLIFRDTGPIPTAVTLQNYSGGWNAFSQPFGHYLWNSVVLCSGTILGNLISCSLAAYAFARMKFRGRGLFFAIMLVTIMLPIQVTIVPQYVLFSQLHWINTFLPLIVPKFLATDAFFIFLMVQFIRAIPRELDEAARIDGAGHFRIFYRIMLPLMVPALATTAIFTFIWTWNDFFGQLIYLATPDKYTASLALASYLDSQGVSNFGGMFAMSVYSLIPLFLVFLIGQRFLLRGISTTGSK